MAYFVSMEAVAYIDGSSLANPGHAALAVRIYDTQERLLQSICEPIGMQTNNFAEYYALLRCLQAALSMGIQRLTIYSDSELICRQLNGNYQVRSGNLMPIYQEALEYIHQFEQFRIIQIKRDSNDYAKLVDRMAREAAEHVQRFSPRLEVFDDEI